MLYLRWQSVELLADGAVVEIRSACFRRRSQSNTTNWNWTDKETIAAGTKGSAAHTTGRSLVA